MLFRVPQFYDKVQRYTGLVEFFIFEDSSWKLWIFDENMHYLRQRRFSWARVCMPVTHNHTVLGTPLMGPFSNTRNRAVWFWVFLGC